jgi:hypothetical protein
VVSLAKDDVAYQDGGNSYVRDYSGGAQRRWPETELARTRADRDIDWIIVVMHQVTISTADHPCNGADLGIRQEWTPLFDEYGVDIVVGIDVPPPPMTMWTVVSARSVRVAAGRGVMVSLGWWPRLPEASLDRRSVRPEEQLRRELPDPEAGAEPFGAGVAGPQRRHAPPLDQQSSLRQTPQPTQPGVGASAR